MPRTRSRSLAATGAVVLALVLSGCGPSDAEPLPSYTPPEISGDLPAETVAALRDAVVHAMGSARASGAIVGVWAPWAGAWVSGLGTQSVEDQTPVTAEMLFRIGDVTRLMTCDVLDALEREEIVPREAIAAQYISVAPHLVDVTLRDLCNGTAGIGMHEPTLREQWHKMPERVWSPQELASYGLGDPRSEVKTSYRNSDSAYVLLGLALERAAGAPASSLFQRHVAAPLGLSATVLPLPPAATPGEPALRGHIMSPSGEGFVCEAPVDITVLSSSVGFTESGAVSTIEELGRYIQATASQALAGGASSPRFSQPLPLSDNDEGWRQATGGAHLVGPLIGQFGSIPGYSTAAFSDPDSGLTVAVVLNDSTDGGMIAAYLAWELAAIAAKAGSGSQLALPFTAEGMRAAIADRTLSCVAAPAVLDETED